MREVQNLQPYLQYLQLKPGGECEVLHHLRWSEGAQCGCPLPPRDAEGDVATGACEHICSHACFCIDNPGHPVLHASSNTLAFMCLTTHPCPVDKQVPERRALSTWHDCEILLDEETATAFSDALLPLCLAIWPPRNGMEKVRAQIVLFVVQDWDHHFAAVDCTLGDLVCVTHNIRTPMHTVMKWLKQAVMVVHLKHGQ